MLSMLLATVALSQPVQFQTCPTCPATQGPLVQTVNRMILVNNPPLPPATVPQQMAPPPRATPVRTFLRQLFGGRCR